MQQALQAAVRARQRQAGHGAAGRGSRHPPASRHEVAEAAQDSWGSSAIEAVRVTHLGLEVVVAHIGRHKAAAHTAALTPQALHAHTHAHRQASWQAGHTHTTGHACLQAWGLGLKGLVKVWGLGFKGLCT